tara:strand:- start:9 stop:539 length:531 start_codon:yes stop_codon:yes gene_type:complete
MYNKAYFAGGCFWCTEAIFIRINGVNKVMPGYMGGKLDNPSYKEVCSGQTGHAEGVKVIYDPKVVSYETLLLIFFTTHDPTTLNRQGNDTGTQYRSAVFYDSKNEKEIIDRVINNIQNEALFENPIITQISPIGKFYIAEDEHLNYYETNTQNPYCQAVISPKINKFLKEYKSILK